MAKGDYNHHPVWLFQPLTYMNNSGLAVKTIIEKNIALLSKDLIPQDDNFIDDIILYIIYIAEYVYLFCITMLVAILQLIIDIIDFIKKHIFHVDVLSNFNSILS